MKKKTKTTTSVVEISSLQDNPYRLWSNEELREAMDQISATMKERNDKMLEEEQRKLNINGITAKDFAVIYAPLHEDSKKPSFSFYIVRDGKLHDLNEDAGTWDAKHNFHFHPWWPVATSEEEAYAYGFTDEEMPDKTKRYNAAFAFIPNGFGEACENCYDFHGTTAEAIERLRKCGFTQILDATLEAQAGGWYQAVYEGWVRAGKP